MFMLHGAWHEEGGMGKVLRYCGEPGNVFLSTEGLCAIFYYGNNLLMSTL